MLNNSEQPLDRDPLEQLLESFTPAPVEIDRDQLMFQAGMRAAQVKTVELPALTLGARMRARVWPALALVSTAAALILAVVAWQRPERVVIVERPVEVTTPGVDEVTPPAVKVVAPQVAVDTVRNIDPLANYVRQRDLVLSGGVDAMAQASIADEGYVGRSVPTQRELLKELPGEFGRRKFHVDSDPWLQPWLYLGDRS